MGKVSDMAMDQQQEGVDELLCEIDHWKGRAAEAELLLQEIREAFISIQNIGDIRANVVAPVFLAKLGDKP